VEHQTIYIDANDNDILDEGDVTTTTDANGNYSFTDLEAGNYYNIRQVPQAGSIQTTADPSAINVISGTTATDVDFGSFQLGSIRGQKFNDLDGDGVKDAGEAGLEN
jgi:uncharacterized membrane protein